MLVIAISDDVDRHEESRRLVRIVDVARCQSLARFISAGRWTTSWPNVALV